MNSSAAALSSSLFVAARRVPTRGRVAHRRRLSLLKLSGLRLFLLCLL